MSPRLLLPPLALLACLGGGCGMPIPDSDGGVGASSNASRSACAGDDGGDARHVHHPTGATCPPGSTLTYANFGKDFVARYCLACHSAALACADRRGAPSGVDFDTLQGIRAFSEHIDASAAAGPNGVRSEMPPIQPVPTDAERRMLGDWLACGAP